MFIERPIYRLTDNKVKGLKVSFIEQSLNNRRYEINPQNENFDDLPFDGDESLIARRQLYCINDNMLFR